MYFCYCVFGYSMATKKYINCLNVQLNSSMNGNDELYVLQHRFHTFPPHLFRIDPVVKLNNTHSFSGPKEKNS